MKTEILRTLVLVVFVCTAIAACSEEPNRDLTTPAVRIAEGEVIIKNTSEQALSVVYCIFLHARNYYTYIDTTKMDKVPRDILDWDVFFEERVLESGAEIRLSQDGWMMESGGDLWHRTYTSFPMTLNPDTIVVIAGIKDSLFGFFTYSGSGDGNYVSGDYFTSTQDSLVKKPISDFCSRLAEAFLKDIAKSRQQRKKRDLAEANPAALPLVRIDNEVMRIENRDSRDVSSALLHIYHENEGYFIASLEKDYIETLEMDEAVSIPMHEFMRPEKKWQKGVLPDSIRISLGLTDNTWHAFILTIGEDGVYSRILRREYE